MHWTLDSYLDKVRRVEYLKKSSSTQADFFILGDRLLVRKYHHLAVIWTPI